MLRAALVMVATPLAMLGCHAQGSVTSAANRVASAPASSSPTSAGAAARATKIGVADERSCAIVEGGDVKCWGLLFDDDDERMLLTPTTIGAVGDRTIDGAPIDLAIGSDHSCVLLAHGGVRCWGSNEFGELGDGTHEKALFPTANPGLADAVQVSVGSHFTCARRSNGAVVCFGRNVHDELADGTVAERDTPTLAPSLSGALRLSTSGSRGVAIDPNGQLLLWGGWHQTPTFVATLVALLPGTPLDAPPRAIDVVASVTHACALLSDGTVRCWGDNEFGELGDGTDVSERDTPTPVLGLSHVTQIAVGGGPSCARLADGRARCWGNDNYGQLGDGLFTARATPAPVAGLEHVQQIAIAGSHACALLDEGRVECWGSNISGELGDRTRKNREVRGPVLW